MKDYVVGSLSDFVEGVGVAVSAAGRTIALFRFGDDCYAVSNKCLHKGASLCEGSAVSETRQIRCPWHHWSFDVKSGELEADKRKRIRVYPVTVKDGTVIVSV